MEKDYVSALTEPMRAGIQQAWVMGLTFGMFQVRLCVGGCGQCPDCRNRASLKYPTYRSKPV